MTIMKIIEFRNENNENHENHIISFDNHNFFGEHRTPCENYKQ